MMFVSVESQGLDMLLAMARAPRQRRKVLAAILAVVSILLLVVPLIVVASDGVPHDEKNLLWQGPWLEVPLLAWWVLSPVAALCQLGLRPREATDYLFARAPGARIWLAYLISALFTGMALGLLAIVTGGVLSTVTDLSDVDGRREAFGWLFLRTLFFMVSSWLLCGLGLIVAVIAQALRGGSRYLVGIMVLVLFALAFPIALFVPRTPSQRLAFGLTVTGLIIGTLALLLWIGYRAARLAKATGSPNRTAGLVNTSMSAETIVGVGGSLAAMLLWATLSAGGLDVPATEVLLVCDITRCSTIGLTAVGWLIVALPAACVITMIALWRELKRSVRIALLVGALLLGGNAVFFLPRGKDPFSDLFTGPGHNQVIDGLKWAGVGVAVALVLSVWASMLGSATLPALIRRPSMVISNLALLVVSLGVAIWQAEPAMTRAREIFPATLRMNGDTLTRTLVRDQRGCDGILPGDGLLNAQRCLFSVHAAYVTDDSDAVVTIRAMRYRSRDAATLVGEALPADLRPIGVSGEILVYLHGTRGWVVILTSGHADGRAILPDEQRWVRWPMRQVSEHFIGAASGIRSEPKPNPYYNPAG